MIIDSTAYARLNLDEKQKVDAGKVLINHDPITGRTVIRCKIQEYQHISERVIPLYHHPATDSR